MAHYKFVDPYPVYGYRRTLNDEGLWGMIDSMHAEVLPCIYTYLSVPYPDGKVIASTGSLYDYIMNPIVIMLQKLPN